MFQRNIAIKITASFLLLIFINALGLVSHLGAQTITGKVVGVADGDTINLLQDRTQYKIRLYGIDTPEKRQAFGAKAKRFTSSMAGMEKVEVDVLDTDHNGREVAF